MKVLLAPEHYYRVREWGQAGSHDKGLINTENIQLASIGAIFTSIYHTKQLNPWPNISASHVVKYNQLSACQVEMWLFQDHSSICGHLTSQNKRSLGNFQHQCLPELLVNVHSYPLMVKSVSCCCVCGRQVFFKCSYI